MSRPFKLAPHDVQETITGLYVIGFSYRKIAAYLQNHCDFTVSHSWVAAACRELPNDFHEQRKESQPSLRKRLDPLCHVIPETLSGLSDYDLSRLIARQKRLLYAAKQQAKLDKENAEK